MIVWVESEIAILAKMNIPFLYMGYLTDEQLEDLYEIVPDYMMSNTNTSDDSPDSDFNICEGVITKIAMHMEARGLL